MNKYKQNLRVDGRNVYSYNTHVATIDYAEKTLEQLRYYTQTTQKHINYVAGELGLTLVKKF